jgi:nitroimidazol reductase NimA-like FMN-containing flavoprotein (pyridoxamine 5'-phosphate oxidase superfamily)
MTTDRNGMTVLTIDECLRLLSGHRPSIGRVAFVAEGKPCVLPVNYRFHEGTVVFRTDPGAKLTAASAGQPVAFEIDEIDVDWREGWSVLVQGRAEEVLDDAELARLEALPLRPWGPGAKSSFVRIMSTDISGRRIN